MYIYICFMVLSKLLKGRTLQWVPTRAQKLRKKHWELQIVVTFLHLECCLHAQIEEDKQSKFKSLSLQKILAEFAAWQPRRVASWRYPHCWKKGGRYCDGTLGKGYRTQHPQEHRAAFTSSQWAKAIPTFIKPCNKSVILSGKKDFKILHSSEGQKC